MAAQPADEPGWDPAALARAQSGRGAAVGGALSEAGPQSAVLIDRVRAIRRDVASLPAKGARAAGAWAAEQREAVIADLDAAITELTVLRGTVLLAHREAGTTGVGDRDFTDWRSRRTGAGRGATRGELEVAETLEVIPGAAEAVGSGRLGLEHARALSRVRSGGSEAVKDALSGELGRELLSRAGRMSAPELARAAKKAAARIDAAAAQADQDAAFGRRSLVTGRRGGVATGEWILDPIAGRIVETAIDAVSGPPAKDDDRTREQRRADALVDMASRVLQVGSDLTGAQVRPHLAVLVEEETWAATRTAFAPLPAAAGDGGRPADGEPTCVHRSRPGTTWPRVAPAQLEDGTVVPLRTLAQLMCDCELTRVVMSAASQVLDVGATQRTYSKELRRAVVSRDRHCRWPGCHLRAGWCEVHHITWFSRGGATSVENGITLCSFHHHQVHRHDVEIAAVDGGFRFRYRDGRDIGTTEHPGKIRGGGGYRRTDAERGSPTGTGRGSPTGTRSGSPGTPQGRGSPGTAADGEPIRPERSDHSALLSAWPPRPGSGKSRGTALPGPSGATGSSPGLGTGAPPDGPRRPRDDGEDDADRGDSVPARPIPPGSAPSRARQLDLLDSTVGESPPF